MPALPLSGKKKRERKRGGKGSSALTEWRLFAAVKMRESGERNTFCPEHRPTNAFFPRPPHRAAAKSSPDRICIEWMDGWRVRKKTRERDPKCGMEAIGTKASVSQGATIRRSYLLVISKCNDINNEMR